LGALGLTKITSIDIPGCAHQPDLIQNLNDPFPPALQNCFSTIIDPGTLEHALDLRGALTNLVGALKLRGVIVHFLPIYSYNGGYVSINPNLLNDFYEVNGFSEQHTYIVMWDRYRPYAAHSRCYTYTPAVLGARHALADYDQCRYTPHLLHFARKVSEVAAVKCPIQNEAPSIEIAEPTSQQRIRQRLKALLYRFMPHQVAYELEARLRRRRDLRRIRRSSFYP
jgi:hypothetical protein